jgi:hypothetical protein
MAKQMVSIGISKKSITLFFIGRTCEAGRNRAPEALALSAAEVPRAKGPRKSGFYEAQNRSVGSLIFHAKSRQRKKIGQKKIYKETQCSRKLFLRSRQRR